MFEGNVVIEQDNTFQQNQISAAIWERAALQSRVPTTNTLYGGQGTGHDRADERLIEHAPLMIGGIDNTTPLASRMTGYFGLSYVWCHGRGTKRHFTRGWLQRAAFYSTTTMPRAEPFHGVFRLVVSRHTSRHTSPPALPQTLLSFLHTSVVGFKAPPTDYGQSEAR